MLTLWLIPDGEARQQLQQLITEMSSRHGAPAFEPHITLLSGIMGEAADVAAQAAEFAANTAPIVAAIRNVEYLEEFFRCLFFSTDQSASLIAARRAAEDFFEHTNIQPFIPHVSFLYGSMPVFEKAAIAAQLRDKFLMSLRMPTLRLVRTQRTPEYWETIAEFELNAAAV
jgi:2'-5' RNA ligase